MNEIEVIAECGVNHNGKLETALELIKWAAMSHCDTAKFQLWNTEEVYPRERWDEMKALELSRNSLAHCAAECRARGIRFLCTPDTFNDARYLALCGVERIKIGSSNVTNLPMLREVAKLDLPVILSSGACTDEEIKDALRALSPPMGAIIRDRTLMHCVSAYPAPTEELNLKMIARWRDADYVFKIGFSDHTIGNDAALVALGLGARVFEKHLTLGQDQIGPDHAASIEPFQMYNYVRALREAASMLGDGKKRIMPCEMKNRKEYERFVAQQNHADSPAS